MEEFNVMYLSIYTLGVQYTIVGGVIVSFAFALYRWFSCTRRYIETGKIHDMEGSFFFGPDNWFYGQRNEMYYYNNPWIVLLDIGSVALGIAALAFVWPISIVVLTTITYAKIARVKYKRKKEFMDRLAGDHV